MSTLRRFLAKPWFAALFTGLFLAVWYASGSFLLAGLSDYLPQRLLCGLLTGGILLLPAAIPLAEGYAKRTRTLLRLHSLQSAVMVPYLYLLIWLCVGWLVWQFTERENADRLLAGALLLWAITLAVAALYARKIILKHNTVRQLLGDETKIALLSDLHLGAYTSSRHLQKAVKKVMVAEPDIILIAGDMADVSFSRLRNRERVKQILMGLRAPYGVYRCEGNHDRGAKNCAPESDPDGYFAGCGITLLEDAGKRFPDFYLFGRRESDDPARMEAQAILDRWKNEAPTLPLVVLEHRPEEIPLLCGEGAVVLCGHTHGGQTFPGNLLFWLLSRYQIGHGNCGNGFYCVSAGCGRWGFPARLFTPDEITILKGKKHDR